MSAFLSYLTLGSNLPTASIPLQRADKYRPLIGLGERVSVTSIRSRRNTLRRSPCSRRGTSRRSWTSRGREKVAVTLLVSNKAPSRPQGQSRRGDRPIAK